MIREYVYCVKNPMDGSVACKNPKVVFFTKEGQAIPCPENGDGCITISVPEDVDGCVNGEIICEDCGRCPSKPFTICPCTTSADCENCQKCDNGVCVDICEGLCNNGDCVECINNNDCELGKVCKDGTCQCPAGKNFTNERGECVACLNNTQCSKCQVCINGECVGKACDASCDPNTGECVECVNSGHCQGRTDGKNCCKGTHCDCCEGYIFNVALNTCVPKPDCIFDTDCGVCDICIAGNCQPRICPDGTICINDKCVETCDCSNPTCDRNSACVRYNSTTCICSKCSGSCTSDNNCGDGCYCKDGTCIPNPCNKPCLTGSDCGPGCGCKENKCIPCDSLSCLDETCNTIDGCKCYGSTCQGDPCSGPCNNGADCGQGCGCLNGNCVSCDKLPCNVCAETLGCKCVNGGCTAIPKCNGKCTSSADCGFGCTCYQGNCVSCGSFGCNECFSTEDCECIGGKCEGTDKECTQEFDIEQVECSIKATLDKKQCCNCPEIEVRSNLKEIKTTTSTIMQIPAKDYVYEVTLYKDGVPASNIDFPSTGTIKGEAKYYYIISGIQYEGSTSTTMSFNGGTNKLTFTFTLPDKGHSPISILSYSFHFTQVNNIQFPNGCTYKGNNNTLTFKQYNVLNVGLTEKGTIKSTDCRAPLFTWYRGTNENNVSEKVKESYALNGGTTWFDYISSCEDGFCSGYYYKARTDCGCTLDTLPLKASACATDLEGAYSMDNFKFSVTDCGLKFTLTDMFNNCPMNGIIPPTCTKCAGSQVSWIMKLYDASGVVHTKNFIFNMGSEIVGYTFTSSTPLIKVTLEHSQNPECKYTKHLTPGIPVTTGLNCDTMSVQVNVGEEDAPIQGCTVELYLNEVSGSPLVTQITNVLGIAIFNGLTPNAVYKIKTTCSGCNNVSTVVVNCCTSNGNDMLLASYNPSTSKIDANVLPGDSNKTYQYYLEDVIISTGGSSVSIANPLTNGTYSFKSVDNKGCVAGPINLIVDNCPITTISISALYDSTIGSEKVEITDILGNGVSPYTIQLINSANIVVRESTNVTTFPIEFIATDLPDGNYTIKATCSQGCVGQTSILLQKGLACSLNPADINASRPYPQNADCAPSVHTKLWVNNANTPYTVETYKNGVLLVDETFTDGGDSPSTNITYVSTVGANDEYEVAGLSDGLYTFKVIDDRGCTDTVQVNIACNCVNPINVNSQGIVCNGSAHKLVINSITGGQTPGTYLLQIYQNATCADGVGGAEVIAEVTVTSGYTEVPIPVGNQQSPGDQYSIKLTSGNCTTNCIVLNAPDCSGVECIENVEAYWRGEVNCANAASSNFKVWAINNSGKTLTYQIYRKANTIVGACPSGTNCDTTGYTMLTSGTVTNGQTACYDNISASPDGTACFLVKFIETANPSCTRCLKPTLKTT